MDDRPAIFATTVIRPDDGDFPYFLERRGNRFSDVVSGATPGLGVPRLCLISLDGHDIHAVGLAKSGPPVATLQKRIDFTDVQLVEPFSLAAVAAQLPLPLQRWWPTRAMSHPSLIPANTWRAAKTVIGQVSPEAARALENLGARLNRGGRRGGPGIEVIAHERDAVAVALQVAGFDRQLLNAWEVGEGPAPFLSRVSHAVIREDQMIQHDSNVLPGWERLAAYQLGAVTFARDGHRITVMNVNRTPIEETLGVDLAYYNYGFRLFVLVQYKRFASEERDDERRAVGRTRLVYRPARDRSLLEEIARMQAIDDSPNDWANLDEFRLHPRSCYIKLCVPELLDPFSTDLIHGMYIPLEYWQRLCTSPAVLGPRGGVAISYDESPEKRYLNNTMFIQLLQGGWIGSRGVATDAIQAAIERSIETGRSVIVALHEPSSGAGDQFLAAASTPGPE